MLNWQGANRQTGKPEYFALAVEHVNLLNQDVKSRL